MNIRHWLILLAFSALCAGAVLVVRAREPSVAAPTRVAVEEAEAPAASHREPVFAAVEKTAPVAPATPAAGVPMRWARLNREAIEALDAGQHARAIELFEQCLKAVPAEHVFATNLAEALARLSVVEYERGTNEDRALAIEHLKRAIELAPEREDLAKRLAQLEKLAQSEQGFWTEASEHFVLSYDGSREDLMWSSYQITQVLEGAYQSFGELFGVYPGEGGRPKVRVVLYRRAGFHEATGIGHWAGGLYDGSVRVPVEDLGREKADLERVLRHEIVHAFVRESGGDGVPGWLNEGLAQWLESPQLARRSADVRAARARLAGHALLPLDKLQKSLGQQPDADAIALAYAEALAFVDHLERNAGERVLFEMVAGCRSNATCDKTFRQRSGTELASALDDLGREL